MPVGASGVGLAAIGPHRAVGRCLGRPYGSQVMARAARNLPRIPNGRSNCLLDHNIT